MGGWVKIVYGVMVSVGTALPFRVCKILGVKYKNKEKLVSVPWPEHEFLCLLPVKTRLLFPSKVVCWLSVDGEA